MGDERRNGDDDFSINTTNGKRKRTTAVCNGDTVVKMETRNSAATSSRPVVVTSNGTCLTNSVVKSEPFDPAPAVNITPSIVLPVATKLIKSNDLLVTKLSSYIEGRVNNFLKKRESEGFPVTVRVVSSSDKHVQVRERMKQKFESCMRQSFPYRSKTIMAFQGGADAELCFFGMFVQEYGSSCPPPNSRRVYISYLDSIHFFEPRRLRTSVYQEIVLGYLEYAKEMGFAMAHIWACPPNNRDDYIFNGHPQEQKMPDILRLHNWYEVLLDKGKMYGIVADYKDNSKYAQEEALYCATQIPYFDGDIWPATAEEAIKNADSYAERNNSMELPPADDNAGSESKAEHSSSSKKSNKKRKLFHHRRPSTLQAFSQRLLKKVEKSSYVIRLVPRDSKLGAISDPDPLCLISCVDTRCDFLDLCRNKGYEFSTLLNAKYSTVCVVEEIYKQQNLVRTSNSTTQIDLLVKTLEHAVQCKTGQDCPPKCATIKLLLNHAKMCPKKTDCPVCKQLFALCGAHRKQCVKPDCVVPLCLKQRNSNGKITPQPTPVLDLKR